MQYLNKTFSVTMSSGTPEARSNWERVFGPLGKTRAQALERHQLPLTTNFTCDDCTLAATCEHVFSVASVDGACVAEPIPAPHQS